MWTSAHFGAKASDFSNFMVCPHGQRERGEGIELLQTVCGQGGKGGGG